MKISILTNLYPPFTRGGAEYLTHHLAGQLVKLGHQVSVVTTAPGQARGWNKFETNEEAGIKVNRFTPFNFYYYLNSQSKPWLLRLAWQIVNLWSPRVKTILLNYFKAYQPDLVISSNLMGLGFGAVKAIHQAGLGHIHILHDVQLLQPSGLFFWHKKKDNLLEKIYQWFTKRIFSSVGAVVAPSVWLLREHETRGFFNKAVRLVIPNPVPDLAVTKSVNQEASKELLYVGQAAEHKGVFWLINTLKNSNLKDWRLRLILWTDKNSRQQIDRLIGQDSRFVVNVGLNQQTVDDYMAQAYLTIMPSLCCENYPTVIVKSLALGRPVLATATGGVPEIIRHNFNGWLFNPGDEFGFLSTLEKLLLAETLVNQAGLQARQNPTALSLADYARRLLQLLNNRNLA